MCRAVGRGQVDLSVYVCAFTSPQASSFYGKWDFDVRTTCVSFEYSRRPTVMQHHDTGGRRRTLDNRFGHNHTGFRGCRNGPSETLDGGNGTRTCRHTGPKARGSGTSLCRPFDGNRRPRRR